MKKISFGLPALAFSLLVPLAAQANNNPGLDFGSGISDTNVGAVANQVGQQVTSYGLFSGNDKADISSIDLLKKLPGAQPIVKVIKPATVLADDNNHSAHLNF